jgi:hypothetical protein
MKSSGWPSSRTKARWATLGASMRRDTSLSGKWTMATGLFGRFVQRAGYSVPEASPEGRLYYRPAALPAAEGVA